MADFSDVLLTVDFDHTMTGTDARIPERNLEAVRWFMAHGGTFTVNTGRSLTTLRSFLDVIPHNAPLLLYNGSVAYEKGKIVDCTPIGLDMWDTVCTVAEAFPELNLELQGVHNHYLVNQKPDYVAFYDAQGWGHAPAVPGTDVGPFLKFALFGVVHDLRLSRMYEATEEELRRFREVEDFIRSRWGDQVDLFYAAPRVLDVQAKGVSKLAAAKKLQTSLGKKILVCVGDGDNDVPMLEGADYAFCPSDAVVADRFSNVCPCNEGAVADVIYKKIPEILGFSLDSRE